MRFFMAKILKKITPESFMSRMLLIILLPAVAAQIISTYIFYERHWANVRDMMLSSLANEILFVYDLDKKLGEKEELFLDKRTMLRFTFTPDEKINNGIVTPFDEFKKEIKILYELLKEKIENNVSIKYLHRDKRIEVKIQNDQGVLNFEISRKRFYTPSTNNFILWMVGSSALLMLITIIFAKNQIRSIYNLSLAAEKIGCGEKARLKPSGSVELRKAGAALIEMQRRVDNHINQRTMLLAGVSHDLRTPITRIKLSLEMCEADEEVLCIRKDLEQMEATINDYLEFAKGQEKEQGVLFNLSELIKNICVTYNYSFQQIQTEIEDAIFIKGRENQVRRAITNIIDNSSKFAARLQVSLKQKNNYVTIKLYDNGPGMNADDIDKAFQPFYRNEKANSMNIGGLGLGLAIANDIITKHGGTILLKPNSRFGGLGVVIRLPL